MSRQQSSPVQRPTRRRMLLEAAVATVGVTVLVAGLIDPAARAQTPATPLSVSVAIAVPQGVPATGPLPLGQQYAIVSVANPTTQALSNVQIVFRAALAPALLGTARDATQAIGVIDYTASTPAGVWYHTISQVAAGASLQYTITWTMPCPGRYPVAVRVADRVEKIFGTWVGNANPACPPDETAAPQPAAYYSLAWPPSANAATVTSTTSSTTSTTAGSSTTSTSSTTTPSTVASSSTAPSSTVASTAGAAAASTVPGILPSTTATTVATTATTLFTITPGAPATTTTTAPKRTGPTTTVVIVCRTVGGRRYCGPQSSVYKPGQKKAVETKPKVTKKKRK